MGDHCPSTATVPCDAATTSTDCSTAPRHIAGTVFVSMLDPPFPGNRTQPFGPSVAFADIAPRKQFPFPLHAGAAVQIRSNREERERSIRSRGTSRGFRGFQWAHFACYGNRVGVLRHILARILRGGTWGVNEAHQTHLAFTARTL